MARIRTVKPEFWSSEQIVECSTNARLLFIGLWNFCDDAGIHPASAKTIKARVFPADDIDPSSVRRLLDELSSHGLIKFYTVEGVEYLWVTGWSRHQKVERPSFKYPKPPPKQHETPDPSPNDRRTIDARHPPELEIGIGNRNGDDVMAEGSSKDPVLALAVEIVAAYSRAVMEIWNLDGEPLPRFGGKTGDFEVAKGWAQDGVTLALVLDVLGPVLTAKRDGRGDTAPPGGLVYLDKAVRRKLAEIVPAKAAVDPAQEAAAQQYLDAMKAWKEGGRVGPEPVRPGAISEGRDAA